MGPEINPPVRAASAATRGEIQVQERETIATVDRGQVDEVAYQRGILCGRRGDRTRARKWPSGSGVAMLNESPRSELEEEAMGGRGTPNSWGWKGKVINC